MRFHQRQDAPTGASSAGHCGSTLVSEMNDYVGDDQVETAANPTG